MILTHRISFRASGSKHRAPSSNPDHHTCCVDGCRLSLPQRRASQPMQFRRHCCSPNTDRYPRRERQPFGLSAESRAYDSIKHRNKHYTSLFVLLLNDTYRQLLHSLLPFVTDSCLGRSFVLNKRRIFFAASVRLTRSQCIAKTVNVSAEKLFNWHNVSRTTLASRLILINNKNQRQCSCPIWHNGLTCQPVTSLLRALYSNAQLYFL